MEKLPLLLLLMADVFTRKKRSEVMSKIRGSNTKPELIVRRYLFSQGFRFRLHQRSLPGKPDIVLKKHDAIVFVNGCFWHGHKNCKGFRMPKSKLLYWKPKIEKNASNDIKSQRKLKKLGWKVIVVWECKLKRKKVDKTLKTVVDKILT